MTTAIELSLRLVFDIYAQFAGELRGICSFDRHYQTIGQMYHDEERRLLDLMVRHYRPELVIEFSPHKGWTTLHMVRALEDNGAGKIHSFELNADNVATARQVLSDQGLSHRVHFYTGDVRQTLPAVLAELGRPVDFLFVDSDHSYDFGRWWLAEVLPFVRPGGLVHVHNVEYSRRFSWDSLTHTHQRKGIYGPPLRQFVRVQPWQRSLWRGR